MSVSSSDRSDRLVDNIMSMEPAKRPHELNLPLDHWARLRRRSRQIVEEAAHIGSNGARRSSKTNRTSSTGSRSHGSTPSSSLSLSVSDYAELPSDLVIDRIVEARRRKEVRRAVAVLLRDAKPEEIAEVLRKSKFGAAGSLAEEFKAEKRQRDTMTVVGIETQTEGGRPKDACIQCALGSGKLWTKRRSDDGRVYYVCKSTGESRWGAVGFEGWMAVKDTQVGRETFEHSETGEVRAELFHTVWEASKDPDSGRTYYYSNVSKASQWEPPIWIDEMEEESKRVYYRNLGTGRAQWERPEEFVMEVVKGVDGVEPGGIEEEVQRQPQSEQATQSDADREQPIPSQQQQREGLRVTTEQQRPHEDSTTKSEDASNKQLTSNSPTAVFGQERPKPAPISNAADQAPSPAEPMQMVMEAAAARPPSPCASLNMPRPSGKKSADPNPEPGCACGEAEEKTRCTQKQTGSRQRQGWCSWILLTSLALCLASWTGWVLVLVDGIVRPAVISGAEVCDWRVGRQLAVRLLGGDAGRSHVVRNPGSARQEHHSLSSLFKDKLLASKPEPQLKQWGMFEEEDEGNEEIEDGQTTVKHMDIFSEAAYAAMFSIESDPKAVEALRALERMEETEADWEGWDWISVG